MLDDLLAANRQYVTRFNLGELSGQAGRGFGLVTCIDTRLDPLSVLGLEPGDAKIMRNAGGRVTPDVIRSLILATRLLGVTEIAVMHHSQCALAGQSQADVLSLLGPDVARLVGDVDFRSMPDADAALADDVRAVRTCPALPAGLRVEGWRYDVATGQVHRVFADTGTPPAG